MTHSPCPHSCSSQCPLHLWVMTMLRPAPCCPVPFMVQLLLWLSGLALQHPEDNTPSRDLPQPLLLRSPTSPEVPSPQGVTTWGDAQRCKEGGAGKVFPSSSGPGLGETCSPEEVFGLYSVGNGEPSLAF